MACTEANQGAASADERLKIELRDLLSQKTAMMSEVTSLEARAQR